MAANQINFVIAIFPALDRKLPDDVIQFVELRLYGFTAGSMSLRHYRRHLRDKRTAVLAFVAKIALRQLCLLP